MENFPPPSTAVPLSTKYNPTYLAVVKLMHVKVYHCPLIPDDVCIALTQKMSACPVDVSIRTFHYKNSPQQDTRWQVRQNVLYAPPPPQWQPICVTSIKTHFNHMKTPIVVVCLLRWVAASQLWWRLQSHCKFSEHFLIRSVNENRYAMTFVGDYVGKDGAESTILLAGAERMIVSVHAESMTLSAGLLLPPLPPLPPLLLLLRQRQQWRLHRCSCLQAQRW
jgi:hypothetical protein